MAVLFEGSSVFHFNGGSPDVHSDAERLQRSHCVPVKFGHGTRRKRERGLIAVRGLDAQQMVDKIEIDLKDARSIGHRGRRQPARGDVERGVPPMVGLRRQRKPDFTDDLGPHVQRGVRVSPLVERQAWPGLCAGRRDTRSLPSHTNLLFKPSRRPATACHTPAPWCRSTCWPTRRTCR